MKYGLLKKIYKKNSGREITSEEKVDWSILFKIEQIEIVHENTWNVNWTIEIDEMYLQFVGANQKNYQLND